ncbi:MAG TPA: amino acid racemase [Acidimicrobiales bacterium]|jgi:aspartate racemase|nr:amino acid racemase [Acidimicrobiales bacterium]
MKRIGLIGGISWESTSSYYSLLNELTAQRLGAWKQPAMLIDSLDFSEIVAYQQKGDWATLGTILGDSAKRLELGGATVLGIGANTMHKNFDDVAAAVSIPVVDIRDALAREVKGLGATSMSLLGTKYLMEDDFFSSHLERAGVTVVKPVGDQVDVLQAMIFDELTQGLVSDDSRRAFVEIADDCRSRGGSVVGLCCTEFGLLLDEGNAPWPIVDSTVAHVRALMDH